MKLKKIYENFDGEAKLTKEEKAEFLENISNFSNFGKNIYREASLKETVQAIRELTEKASHVALQEGDDWFDNMSVKRDMTEISRATKLFEKTAKDMSVLQQRTESLYEEIGMRLSKYFDMNEAVDHIDDKEAAKDFDDLKDKDVDNDGDVDDSDKYLKHKLSVVAKKDEGITHRSGINEAVKMAKGNTMGSSLAYRMTEPEHKIAMRWLKKNRVSNVLNTLGDKYSDDAVISVDGKLFTIYAQHGQLRFGSGGKLGSEWKPGMEKTILKQMR